MLDFSRVQNYYIACGYTDMRKQIDGLAALVQPSSARKWTRRRSICSAEGGGIGSRRCIGTVRDIFVLIADQDFSTAISTECLRAIFFDGKSLTAIWAFHRNQLRPCETLSVNIGLP